MLAVLKSPPTICGPSVCLSESTTGVSCATRSRLCHAGVEVDVDRADGTDRRGHGDRQHVPAPPPEVQVVGPQQIDVDVVQRVSTHDRQALVVQRLRGVGRGKDDVESEASAHRQRELLAVAHGGSDFLEQQYVDAAQFDPGRQRICDARLSGHVQAGDGKRVLRRLLGPRRGTLDDGQQQTGIRRRRPESCRRRDYEYREWRRRRIQT